MSIVVGAAPGLLETRCPYWSCGSCVRVGGVGSAQIANACEQYVIAATAMAVSEAAVIAERAGLDLSRVLGQLAALFSGKPGACAAQAKLLNRDFEPDLPAGAALAPLEVDLNRHGGRAPQRGCWETCGNSSSCWIELG